MLAGFARFENRLSVFKCFDYITDRAPRNGPGTGFNLMEGCGTMIIVTARIPKKRLLAGAATALCCGLAVIALAFTLGGRSVAVSAEVKNIKSNDDRLAYLNGLGWQVSPQPIATEELMIPEEFDDSYAGYLKLQSDQGFDLTQYRGKRVKRYTYQLINYPTQAEPVQIALLIYKNRVVGGQIQSSSGSFVHGLALPDPTQSAPPAASPAPSAQATGLGQTI